MPPVMLFAASQMSKSYAGVRALSGVSFDLRAGEVHALVGENGAGKSTLIRVMTGAVAPDSGTLSVAGQPVPEMSPALARALGIAAIYQQPSLFPHLTVAENIAFALEPGGPWRRLDWNRRRRDAVDLAAPRRRGHRRRPAGREPEHAGTAARRDCEGRRLRRQNSRHGRAHRVAERTRSGAALSSDGTPAVRRCGHRLHFASPRGSSLALRIA